MAKPTQSEILIRLAGNVELFRTPDRIAYASFSVGENGGEHMETWPVQSADFKLWLGRQFYLKEGKAPSPHARQQAIDTIEAKARFDEGREVRQVFKRIAGSADEIYVDLCDDHWRFIKITPERWRPIFGKNEVCSFERREGMSALPIPVLGETIEILRPFVNLQGDDDWYLFVGWIIAALNPSGPYPILILQGEQDSAKSTVARIARSLVDPSEVLLRSLPNDERDLMIDADNAHVLAFDNLSWLNVKLSNALCRLATGSGFATRKLYTDDNQKIFRGSRPIILNGIEEFATRPDLIDRAIVIHPPIITDTSRRDEKELWPKFNEKRPFILGALCDALSAALRNYPSVQLNSLPRMADAARWVTAAEESLGWPHGSFIAAMERNRLAANALLLESSPIVAAIEELLTGIQSWEGTATLLLQELSEPLGPSEKARHVHNWPRSAGALGNHLHRLGHPLRKIGIDIMFHPTNKQRNIIIRKVTRDAVTTVTTVTDAPPQASASDNSDGGDGALQTPLL